MPTLLRVLEKMMAAGLEQRADTVGQKQLSPSNLGRLLIFAFPGVFHVFC